MDKVKKYEKYILDFLREYTDEAPPLQSGVEAQIIADKENYHYQLMYIGWHKDSYYLNIIFHFDIKNEKIWIQENNTDVLVGKYFVEKGVPKSDIVLGMQPEEVRPFTEFGVA